MISVVCTVYNNEAEILDFFDDLFSQTLYPDEMVITDGGSTDATPSLVLKASQKAPFEIRLFQPGRNNIPQGLNHSILNARGEDIVVMACGNRYDKHFLEELFKARQKTGLLLIASPIRGLASTSFGEKYIASQIKSGIRILSNHGCLISRRVFDTLGLFCPDFVYAGEDLEFYYRCKKAGLIIHVCDEAVLHWKVVENRKDLKKQCKNYVIGEMQIDRYVAIKKYFFIPGFFLSLFFLGVLAGCIVSLFHGWLFFGLFAGLGFFLSVCSRAIWKKKKKKPLFDIMAWRCDLYSQIAFLKNLKYLRKRYRVGL